MALLEKYELGTVIHDGKNTLVYKAHGKELNKPVIIKLLKTEYPGMEQLAKIQQEYDIAAGIQIDGVIHVYEIETFKNGLALVFEDFGGDSLEHFIKKGKLDVKTFLDLALTLTRILGELHRAEIIHKDIKPQNIILNEKTGVLKIIDFGISSKLSRENSEYVAPNKLEGTLAYMSPEQTGRMNRSIDHRTDFYSLGVTFYQMLTGHVPFENISDPLEIVHLHIAVYPDAPHVLMPEIPEVLSRIIMKLMAKNSEDRYQSAFGLKYDLEQCIEQWQKNNTIKDFEPASHDISEKLYIPEKLYGREKEVKNLLDTFRRICRGGVSEILLVTGHGGIGKSALIKEVQKPLVGYRGTFIEGKFDQFKRDVPYSAIAKAFQELIRQVLTEDKAAIELWKEKTVRAVGSNGRIIIDLIPEVEYVIGKQNPVVELPFADAENRFNQIFTAFVTVFAQKEHPLVIFVDDLQWADSASLRLLQLLLEDKKLQYLFVIGAYRHQEVGEDHPLHFTLKKFEESGIPIHKIELQALNANDVSQLLADTVQLPHTEIKELSDLVLGKTRANPFFVWAFLKELYNTKLLNFNAEAGRWKWDIEKIQGVGISDNVVDLMAGKIKKLQGESQHPLELAACIGNVFELKILATVAKKSPMETVQILQEAINEGLILPVGNSYKLLGVKETRGLKEHKIEFKFLHDRVQQAAHSLLTDEVLVRTNYLIGEHLLESYSKEELEENIISIVNHLNIGKELIVDEVRIEKLTEMNLRAARVAKNSTAYESALKYLEAALSLLPENAWEKNYSLTLGIYNELITNKYLTANVADAERFSDIVLEKSTGLDDKLPVYELQIQFMTSLSRFNDAIRISAAALKQLGVSLPQNPGTPHIIKELLKTKMAQGFKDLDSFYDIPEMTDERRLATMRILMYTTSPAFFGRPNLYPIIGFIMVQLTIKYGISELSAYGFSSLAIVLIGVVGDFENGYKSGILADKLLTKFGARQREPQVYFFTGYFIRHVKEHVKDCLVYLEEGLNGAIEVGNIEFQSFLLVGIGLLKIDLGSPLDELMEESARGCQKIVELGQEHSLHSLTPIWQLAENLQGKAVNDNEFKGSGFDEHTDLPELIRKNIVNALFAVYSAKSMLHFFTQDYEQAYDSCKANKKYLDGGMASILLPDYYYYFSLSCVQLYRKTKKKSYLKQVKKNQKVLKKWSDIGPMNRLHKYLLIEAEVASSKGKMTDAEINYRDAINAAEKNGYIHDVAIANELAGRHFQARGLEKVALSFLMEARYNYKRWGCIIKVKQIDLEFPALRTRGLRNPSSSRTHTSTEMTMTTNSTTGVHTAGSEVSSGLDLGSIMKASRIISGEIKLEKLLSSLMKTLVENAGAQKGALVISRKGEYIIEAVKRESSAEISVLESIPVADSLELSPAIINYVERTKEFVVLNNAVGEGQFTNDAYIKERKPKSIICTPIINQGKLIGMLYLENNATTGAFTEDRIQTLNMLSSQAAVSLDNALLYSNLEEKVEERTTELRASKKEIDDIFSNVEQGLMAINPDHTISSEYSLKAKDIFERDDLGGLKFENLFTGNPETQRKIKEFLEELFTNVFMSMTLFERANPLANYHYEMVNEEKNAVTRVLDFKFSRIFGIDEAGKETKKIQKIMLVVDDKTAEYELTKELEKKAEVQSGKVEKLYQILQLKPRVFSHFISESAAALEQVAVNIRDLGSDAQKNKELLRVVFREVHTLKGNARALNLDSIGKTAHELEDIFEELKEKPDELTEELKEKTNDAVRTLKDDIQDGNALFEKILNMQSALQNNSNDVMDEFEDRFRQIVLKEAKESGKQVEFIFQNELESPLKETIINKLYNPLSHIIRNSVSHGIESADVRKTLSKPEKGHVTLRLTKSNGPLTVICEDDGGGLNTAKIREKALTLKLFPPEQLKEMSDNDVNKLIFSSGLSTKDSVSNSAGRGVGMDAVKEDLRALKAVIQIGTRANQYTRFTIQVPEP